jgi:type 1 glutamine amidotransferase
MSKFKPSFAKYKLIVLDYNGDSWPDETKKAFIDYVSNGGGVVAYHEASMAFPDWKEYNEMIGLGLGNGRDKNAGPYAYFRNNNLVVDDTAAGPAGVIISPREYILSTRNAEHPIMKGLPVRWMHGRDQLFSKLRGPAKNMEVLATASSDTMPRMRRPGAGGGKDEPLLMAITYGKGRIFNTLLGFAEPGGGPAMQCVGFIVTFQRGAEWAATGEVTQKVPFDFPTGAGLASRPDFKTLTIDDDFKNIGAYDIGKSTKYMTDIQNRIREAAGDPAKLLEIETMMVGVLKDQGATSESKKLMLRELSWMGSDYCIPAIEALVENPDVKDEAGFALARLK